MAPWGAQYAQCAGAASWDGHEHGGMHRHKHKHKHKKHLSSNTVDKLQNRVGAEGGARKTLGGFANCPGRGATE